MSFKELNIFANPATIACGWYWALPSADLKQGSKKELHFLGETLLLYRGDSGAVHCIEAFCPHMGAHLKEGKIEGENIRCGFHGWKFSGSGKCVSTSCSSNKISTASIPFRRTYRVAEKFGMIWIHTDADPRASADEVDPLPDFPALKDRQVLSRVDQVEVRNCHPTLILGGGVDEEHFLFVHHETTAISGSLRFEHDRISKTVISFENTAEIKQTGFKSRLMHRLYQGILRYRVTYWYGATALAELGPPILPLYSIFCYRPTLDGRTEGLNIYVTPDRGFFGNLLSRFALSMTRRILRKGGGEDAVIQNSIRFDNSPYVSSEGPFAEFVRYIESQPCFEIKTGKKRASAPMEVMPCSR